MYVKLIIENSANRLQEKMNDFLDRIEDDKDITKIYVAISGSNVMGLIAYKGNIVEE